MVALKSIYIILSGAFLLSIVQCTAPSVDSGAGDSKKANTFNEPLIQFSKQMRHQGKIKQNTKALNQQIIKLSQQARYNEAIKTAKKVLTIYEKELGPDHPFVAEALDQLALLYETIGDYMNAEFLRKNSLAIREEAFEADNPFVSISLNNLAQLSVTTCDFTRAHDCFKRAQSINTRLIEQIMGFTNEDQKIKFIAKERRFICLYQLCCPIPVFGSIR
ncbi:MAG: tetratricopeptide repeat protein [Desulfatiglandales bacterium]